MYTHVIYIYIYACDRGDDVLVVVGLVVEDDEVVVHRVDVVEGGQQDGKQPSIHALGVQLFAYIRCCVP